MSERNDVYTEIDREREYQDALWGLTQECGQHNVTEFLVYIEDYVNEAKHVMSRYASPGADEKSLHIMRKVAALAVACMEQNGALTRDMSDLNRRKV